MGFSRATSSRSSAAAIACTRYSTDGSANAQNDLGFASGAWYSGRVAHQAQTESRGLTDVYVATRHGGKLQLVTARDDAAPKWPHRRPRLASVANRGQARAMGARSTRE